MTKTQKTEAVELLKEKFSQYEHFYLTDSSSLTVAQINQLRRVCFEKKVEMRVAKNTLIRRALNSINEEAYTGVYDALKGQTAIFFSENQKEPAVILSDFRKDQGVERPVLKAAVIEENLFVGDGQLAVLKKLKSRQELIGEIIGLLQSPAKNVISALQSGGNKLSGILKALEERAQ